MLQVPPQHPADVLSPMGAHPWMPDWLMALTGWQPPQPGLMPVPQNMQAPEQQWLEQMRREQEMRR